MSLFLLYPQLTSNFSPLLWLWQPTAKHLKAHLFCLFQDWPVYQIILGLFTAVTINLTLYLELYTKCTKQIRTRTDTWQNQSFELQGRSSSPVTVFGASNNNIKAQVSDLLAAEFEHAWASYPITQSILIAIISLKYVNIICEGQLHITLNDCQAWIIVLLNIN